MIIKSVRLVNFRNRKDWSLRFDKELTSILGENGCGKTSVLEGIYEALQGKSWRAVDREIVQRGASFYRIEVVYTSGKKVTVTYRAGLADGLPAEKKFMTEGKDYKRLPANCKHPIVLFEPCDLDLMESSPSRRRKYFDRVIGQLDPNYGSSLNKYKKALTQRNELLKKEELAMEELFPWNMTMAKYGCDLRRRRMRLVRDLNEQLTRMYRSIAENEDEVRLEYVGDGIGSEGDYLARLEKMWDAERAVGHTMFGAHRDDYGFWFNRAMANRTASRGEVRSIVIALKFIEAELISTNTRKKPLVLLDDVFSELDKDRQQALMRNFRNNQIILTSAK